MGHGVMGTSKVRGSDWAEIGRVRRLQTRTRLNASEAVLQVGWERVGRVDESDVGVWKMSMDGIPTRGEVDSIISG